MATQKTIEVIIDENGDANIEVSGFSDAQCLKETEALERALGAVTGRTKKNHAAITPAVGTPSKVGTR